MDFFFMPSIVLFPFFRTSIYMSVCIYTHTLSLSFSIFFCVLFWIRIFIYFLQASLSNAFISYKDLCQQNMTYVEFLFSISISLIGNQSSRKRRGRPIHCSPRNGKQIQQTLKKNSPSVQLLAHMLIAGSGGRCKYCSTRTSLVFSSIKCSFCEIFLCVEKTKSCFLLFHEKLVEVLRLINFSG